MEVMKVVVFELLAVETGVDHLKVGPWTPGALVVTTLRLEVLRIDPHELTAAILELVSKDRVLGDMGPDRLIPWVDPPE
jgi:hypothetical protein